MSDLVYLLLVLSAIVAWALWLWVAVRDRIRGA